MKIANRLAARQREWIELDRLCLLFESRWRRRIRAEQVSRFASLYRSACADLALAESYQLPPNTIQYLHQLVGRAHNQLYRSRTFEYSTWGQRLFVDVPQRIFTDGCVQTAFALFWVMFGLSAFLAATPTEWPEFAERVLGDKQIEQLENNFAESIQGRDLATNQMMAAFYIYHNTGIGLKCFAGGMLVLPGVLITLFNATVLGASFGYMARPDVSSGINFFHFVTAHGPFELTAIVLSAGAGLRLGVGWIKTDGLTRIDSLTRTAREAMPIMATAMLLFLAAAFIEGFVSPSGLPYSFKAFLSVLCSGILMFYFVVLGYPREDLLGAT